MPYNDSWLPSILNSGRFTVCLPFKLPNSMQAHKSPWAERLYFHYYPHPPGAFADYYGVALAGFLLVWFLAGAMFLLLRLTARFPLSEAGLRILGGIVAVAGYPLMVLYTSENPLLFVELEVGIAIVFAVLYSVRRWTFSRSASILLLVLHLGLWSGGVWGFFLRGTHKIYVEMWPGWLLLWPGWYWKRRGHEVMGLVFNSVYPLLALSCTLVWIRYVKQSGAQPALPVPEPPPHDFIGSGRVAGCPILRGAKGGRGYPLLFLGVRPSAAHRFTAKFSTLSADFP